MGLFPVVLHWERRVWVCTLPYFDWKPTIIRMCNLLVVLCLSWYKKIREEEDDAISGLGPTKQDPDGPDGQKVDSNFVHQQVRVFFYSYMIVFLRVCSGWKHSPCLFVSRLSACPSVCCWNSGIQAPPMRNWINEPEKIEANGKNYKQSHGLLASAQEVTTSSAPAAEGCCVGRSGTFLGYLWESESNVAVTLLE